MDSLNKLESSVNYHETTNYETNKNETNKNDTNKNETNTNKSTKNETTKEQNVNTLNTPLKIVPIKPKLKKPSYSFKIPDFCKECREFVLNLKFHNKSIHGATCEICLSVFDNREKLEKHQKQWHKEKNNKEINIDTKNNDSICTSMTEQNKNMENESMKILTKKTDAAKKNELNTPEEVSSEKSRASQDLKVVADGKVNSEKSSQMENIGNQDTSIPPITPVSERLSQVELSGPDNNKFEKKPKKTQASIKTFFDVIVID